MSIAKTRKYNKMQYEIFAMEYVKSGCLASAYRSAYPGRVEKSDTHTYSSASRLSKREDVKELIEKYQKIVAQEFVITIDEIFSDVHSIAKDTEVKSIDRLKGYDMLAKWKGAYVEKRSVSIESDSFEIVRLERPDNGRGVDK